MLRPTVRLITNTCDKGPLLRAREKLSTGGKSAEDRLAGESLADHAREASLASGSKSSEPDVFRSLRETIRKQSERGTRSPRLERIAPLQTLASAIQRAMLPVLHSEIHWAEGRTTSRSGRGALRGKGSLLLERCVPQTRGR